MYGCADICWGKCPSGLGTRSLFGEDFADDSEHFVAHKGLRDGAASAEFAGEFQIIGVAIAAAAGHGDDFDVWGFLAKLDDGLKTLFLGHYDVGNDQRRVFFAKKVQSLDAVASRNNVVARAGKGLQDQFANSEIVFDHQDLVIHTRSVVRLLPPFSRHRTILNPTKAAPGAGKPAAYCFL